MVENADEVARQRPQIDRVVGRESRFALVQQGPRQFGQGHGRGNDRVRGDLRGNILGHDHILRSAAAAGSLPGGMDTVCGALPGHGTVRDSFMLRRNDTLRPLTQPVNRQ